MTNDILTVAFRLGPACKGSDVLSLRTEFGNATCFDRLPRVVSPVLAVSGFTGAAVLGRGVALMGLPGALADKPRSRRAKRLTRTGSPPETSAIAATAWLVRADSPSPNGS